MQTFQDAIQAVKKSEDYPNTLEAIIAYLYNERGEVDRSVVDQLIKDLSTIVTSNKFQPITKFYAVMIAKDVTLQKIGMFIAALASSTLLQEMVRLAKQVDPKKKVSEKGLKLFSGNPELGNRYMTLVLQCIVVWEMKFPTTQKKTPTKFRIYGEDVRSSGVVLPKEFVYFDLEPKTQKSSQGETPQPPKDNQSQYDKSPEAHLRHSLSKIQGLATTLANNTLTQDAQREIVKFHRFFIDDSKRIQANFNTYLENMKQDDINLLMELNNFYCEEQKIFKVSLEGSKDLNDIVKYKDMLEIPMSSLYPYFSTKQKKLSKDQNQPKQARISKQLREQVQQKPSSKTEMRNSKQQLKRTDSYEKRQEEQKQVQSPIERIDQRARNTQKSTSNIRRSSLEQDVQDSQVKEFQRDVQEAEQKFNKMFAASSSVHMGFNGLKNLLENQRNQIVSHGSRFHPRDRSRTPVQDYRSRSRNDMTNQSMSQSKVSIFQLFPDVKVSRVDYLGTVISKVSSFYSQLSQVSEAQGPRRFKCSNFKAKSILFENDNLQIGFKSCPYYEQVPPYKAFLQISMFFGNKSEDTITHLGAEFEGDRNCILYANPSKAEPTIEGCYQSKQQLLVIPLALPFSLVTLKLKYTMNRQITRATIALPVTILKFTKFQRIDLYSFKTQFEDLRKSVIRTQPFYLSHNMPPASVKRYLSQLTEITDYNQFITQKTYMEYKLCVKALILNQYDCLIKIRVRPNMTVVVQVTPCQPNVKHSKAVATFLLQTLRFVLEKQN